MKSLIGFFCLALLLFSACEDLDPNVFEPLPGQKPTAGADYLPLYPDTTWTYFDGVQSIDYTLGSDTTISGESYQRLFPNLFNVDTLLFRRAGSIIFSREVVAPSVDSILFLPILDTNRAIGDTWTTVHLSKNGSPLTIQTTIEALEESRIRSGVTYPDVIRVVQRISEDFFDPFTGESEPFIYGINAIWFARDVGIIERTYYDRESFRLVDF